MSVEADKQAGLWHFDCINLAQITQGVILMNEIWKSIVGFDGYEVSNFGRVKSLYKGERILRNYTQSRIETRSQSPQRH